MIKSYHDIEAWGMDAEWKEVIARANKLYESGKGSSQTEMLSKSLAMAVLDYLYEIGKDKGNKEACISERMKQLENRYDILP